MACKDLPDRRYAETDHAQFGPAKVQSPEETYRLLRTAVVLKRPIAAVDDGGRRLLCLPLLRHNKVERHPVFCYPYGGGSKSGLPPKRGVGSRHCVTLEKLSNLKLLDHFWQTGPHAGQRCTESIDLDAQHQPDREPQKGQ